MIWDPLVWVALPAVLLLLALWLGLRETRLYARRRDFDADLFVYSRRRYLRRMTGVGATAALGLVFFLGLRPGGIGSREHLSLFGAAVVTLLVVMIAVPFLDMLETGRRRPPRR